MEYEHQNSCDKVKERANGEMLEERNFHNETEKENRKAKEQKKKDYVNEDMNNIVSVEEKEKMLQDQLGYLKETLEFTKKDVIMRFDLKVEKLRAELELRMKVEIHEIEERKNQHINDLMNNHEEAFREIKQYYNDITR